ncbi:hypothetical protein HHK36_024197 [Tetracentron sinense]|uniref:procollagen-proline 3-dioxygenase n=1 Tax=Tetracentron sinense TaxID=13715 RepID=A0A834YND9_TETSI|nr:hypothetical protein HHK36_024197 [Tetracentron sinense]
MGDAKHPRLVLHNFLSLDLCKVFLLLLLHVVLEELLGPVANPNWVSQELEFIHKSCSTVGYRPNVFSTTLSHLIATNSSHLIFPFVSIRERLKEKAEEFFGCEYELFVEFTGLISWSRGASIGWHSDDNRSYLKQREFAAVCYLNSHGKDFKGGLFNFQDGDPATIAPVVGDVVMYTADTRNIHSVDEITDGERITLTLWFSRDGSHDEDSKLISLLSQSLLNSLAKEPVSYLPLPASSNMYWFSLDQASQPPSGFDIRWARVHVLGYAFCSFDDKGDYSMSDLSNDPSELLMKPLQLAREDELFDKEFVNSLHALQVLQFYFWKATQLQATKVETATGNVVRLSESLREKINSLKSMLLNDHQLAETVFSHMSCDPFRQPTFDWADFSAAVAAWEDYTCKLHKEMLLSLSYWRSHQSIFSVPLLGIEKRT